MRVTERELNNYYKQIKKLLVCKRSEQKKFICSFADNVEEYLNDHPDTNLTELQETMGTPQEIANEFLANESADRIKSKISIVKCLALIGGVIVSMLFIALVIEIMDAHRDNNGYHEETITKNTVCLVITDKYGGNL